MPSRVSVGICPADFNALQRMPRPPAPVKKCLAAAFLLLGYSLYQSLNIFYLHKEMARRAELLRKMAAFDPKARPASVVTMVREMLKPYTEEIIRNCSTEAVAFFLWAKRALEAVEANGTAKR